MRTTLTLDDDVAALLGRIRQAGKGSLKAIVNDALRQGLREMKSPSRRRKPYQTRTVSLGRLVGNIDDISEAIAMAEGEDFR